MEEREDTGEDNDLSESLTAAVCASDALVRKTLDAAVENSEFSLSYSVSFAGHLLTLIGKSPIALVVLDNELPSQLGVDWIAQIRETSPDSTVLLVTNDLTDALRTRAMGAGAFGIVHKTELRELSGALHRAHRWLRTGVEVEAGERRSDTDRRQHLDWNKVTLERRSGNDRRERDAGPPGEATN